MGRIVSARCPDCGYESRLSLGGGSMKPEIRAFIGRFNENVMNEIKQWRKTHSSADFETDVAVGHCEKCGSVEEMRVLTIYDSDETAVFENSCTICYERLKRVEINNDKTPCPRCKTVLAFDTIGFWD